MFRKFISVLMLASITACASGQSVMSSIPKEPASSGITVESLGNSVYVGHPNAYPGATVTVTRNPDKSYTFKTTTGITGTVSSATDGGILLTSNGVTRQVIAPPARALRPFNVNNLGQPCIGSVTITNDQTTYDAAMRNYTIALGFFAFTLGVSLFGTFMTSGIAALPAWAATTGSYLGLVAATNTANAAHEVLLADQANSCP